MTVNGISAHDLLTAGHCSPQCLMALDPDGECDCVCSGVYHGHLRGARVSAARWYDEFRCGNPEVVPFSSLLGKAYVDERTGDVVVDLPPTTLKSVGPVDPSHVALLRKFLAIMAQHERLKCYSVADDQAIAYGIRSKREREVVLDVFTECYILRDTYFVEMAINSLEANEIGHE